MQAGLDRSTADGLSWRGAVVESRESAQDGGIWA